MTGENYLKAAYSYLYIRDFAKAADAFRRAIESNPDNPSYYFHASVTALRNDCHNLALEWAEEAVRLEPDNPLYREHQLVVKSSVLTTKGHTSLLEGDESGAVGWFDQALQFDPLNDEARACLERLRVSAEPIDKPQVGAPCADDP